MLIDSIIWDWNGTLLNDAHLSVQTINSLLTARNIATLSHSEYLEVFTFPVIDYYRSIGFDFTRESFEIPARQYIELYGNAVDQCLLHVDAIARLAYFADQGKRQFILSAMEQAELERTVALNRINHYFHSLHGLDNHFAVSKVEVGRRLMEECGLTPERTVLIGDTIHDYEVAQALGCHSILVANGHQSKARLLATGACVVETLTEITL